jgi:Domain of unknown function (DUF4168)
LELIPHQNLQTEYRLIVVIFVMKFPLLFQVSLLVCSLSIVTATQQAMASSANLSSIELPVSASPQLMAARSEISNSDMRKYALAIIEINPLRLEALQEIEKVSGSTPRLACHQPGNIDSLPASARRIFVNYCARASEIAAKHGLTMANFNRITTIVANDADERARLQKQVNCLQAGSC